jgi:hypothetical protein
MDNATNPFEEARKWYDAIKRAIEQKRKDYIRPTASAVLSDGSLVEIVYRPDAHKTLLCISKDGSVRFEPSVTDRGLQLVPYSPNNNLLTNEVVLFPSEPVDYGSDEGLVAEIRAFIHRYADISPLYEQIAAYYVLFTWMHDAFNELPYLRVRGDTGCGKTRFLLTVGSLCYKPIFASGASTVSPLFRILDAFRGTLIVDEGDFRFSDEKAEVIKILNNGNARGFPVLRSESVRGREYDPRAYTVFGPKLVATRGYFEDRALESRCLTEEMGGRKLRDDIPINLDSDWKIQARDIRNRLLMFRLRNFGKRTLDATLVDRSIEPRLSQVFVPLLSIIDDPKAKADLQSLARAYHRELVTDRGFDIEAQVLDVIRTLQDPANPATLSIKEIAALFADRHENDFDRKITPHWIGRIIRRKLGLKTEKRHGNYVIAASETPKLCRLMEKYDIREDEGGLGDLGDSPREEQPILAVGSPSEESQWSAPENVA